MQWDYDKIKRAVVILIKNAFKYTGENGKITLSIEDMNKHIKIIVKDNGIGIKEDEQNRKLNTYLFQRTKKTSLNCIKLN